MKKIKKPLSLSRETLHKVQGGWTWATLIGQCPSIPPKCPSNWITHCEINGDTGYTCANKASCRPCQVG